MLVYFCALLTLDLQRSRCLIGFWELALSSLINRDGVPVGIFLLLLLSLDGDDSGLSTIVGLPDGGTSSSMSIGSFTCYGCFC